MMDPNDLTNYDTNEVEEAFPDSQKVKIVEC